MFDRTRTLDAATAELHESYQWSIDGASFELAVHGDKIIRTPGRPPRRDTHREHPGAGQPRHRQRQSVAEAIEDGHITLKGSKTAIRRMFDVIGFPLVRLGC